jgi:hypothetical protein
LVCSYCNTNNTTNNNSETTIMHITNQPTTEEASVLCASALEIVYLVPAACIPRFSDFFTYIDNHCQELGIESYGITTTTLEEVFLQIAAEDEEVAQSLINRTKVATIGVEPASSAISIEQQQQPQQPQPQQPQHDEDEEADQEQ